MENNKIRTKNLVTNRLGIAKHGIIFESGQEKKAVHIGKTISRLKLLAKWLGRIGSGLVAVSLLGIVVIYIPLGFAELKYVIINSQVGRGVRIVNKQIQNFEITESKFKPLEKPEWDVPDEGYSINIPKIMAVSRVVAEVDANNQVAYQAALKRGVAEAAGLGHPGMKGTTYLFAHSVGNRVDFARYNAVFYLLDKLEAGDKIEVVYKTKLFKYEVAERKVILANDVEYLIPQWEEERLILQTCYPPGTTWKRLIVIAQRI